jgi:MoaA/NifB/PqqE/SkfB family radical SAM enzyme
MGKISSCAKIGYEVSKRFIFPKISRANISITSKCNQKCLTCNIWDTPIRFIDGKEFNYIIASNKLLWVTLTGGEPSTHPEFERIVWNTLEFTPLVQINTNGILGRKIEEAVKFALQGLPKGIIIVSVSIFGDEAHHDMITRIPGSYNHAVATIKRLKGLDNNRLIVGIAHTICQYNTNQIPHVELLAKTLSVGVSYAIERHAGYYHNEEDGDGFKPYLPSAKVSLNPLDIFKNAFIMHGDRKAGCVAGQYSCWVMPDMTVYPCISAIPDKPSFNLKDSGFQFRGFENSRDYVKHCQGCWTACETYQTILFRPWRILK